MQLFNECILLHSNACILLHSNACNLLHSDKCNLLHFNACTLLHSNSCSLLHLNTCNLLHLNTCNVLHFNKHIKIQFLALKTLFVFLTNWEHQMPLFFLMACKPKIFLFPLVSIFIFEMLFPPPPASITPLPLSQQMSGCYFSGYAELFPSPHSWV